MLRIRAEQVEIFEELAWRRFSRWLEAHVRTHWPAAVAAIGEGGLDGVLREAVERARGFGLQGSVSIARYVDLVMLLGPGFPDDPRIRWAGDILRSTELQEEQKIRHLGNMLQSAEVGEVEPATWESS